MRLPLIPLVTALELGGREYWQRPARPPRSIFHERSLPAALCWRLNSSLARSVNCTACDAELILANVVPEITAAIRGFENHTFICSGCHIRVRRIVFTRHGREEEPKPPPNLFDHLMARVRG